MGSNGWTKAFLSLTLVCRLSSYRAMTVTWFELESVWSGSHDETLKAILGDCRNDGVIRGRIFVEVEVQNTRKTYVYWSHDAEETRAGCSAW